MCATARRTALQSIVNANDVSRSSIVQGSGSIVRLNLASLKPTVPVWNPGVPSPSVSVGLPEPSNLQILQPLTSFTQTVFSSSTTQFPASLIPILDPSTNSSAFFSSTLMRYRWASPKFETIRLLSFRLSMYMGKLRLAVMLGVPSKTR